GRTDTRTHGRTFWPVVPLSLEDNVLSGSQPAMPYYIPSYLEQSAAIVAAALR
ncbi:hypothetical protein THAOC_22261, partial [Thalassiosira oceanica]